MSAEIPASSERLYRMNRVAKILCGTALGAVVISEAGVATGALEVSTSMGIGILSVAALATGIVIDERGRNQYEASQPPPSARQQG